ncbi:putative membrane protein YfcA [Lactobacillus colini]|uniref:Probable membrane transporter protein n=1 Tax=Lactobacillus colini TaxID=1819254 RepID=A0ABS4MEY2_9LACO|nr:sulfite exporter TauE/SafE family protein [Lactobacillus colini]MBP2058183.1 putative membrane protein YfcA [Lactobacillus colini]
MSIGLFAYLLFGGILGGLLSTIASMASLATYPFLLSAGIPPVYANTTNDAALIWGGVGSTVASLKELSGHWKQVWFYSIFTVVGTALGCFLLINFPGEVFEKIVPFCIAFSGITILFSGKVNMSVQDDDTNNWLKVLSLVSILIVGIYAGYFGAASGVLLLVILNFITEDDFLTVNAMKNLIGGLSSLVALLIYMFTEKIYWLAAIPMAIGVLIGSFLGPKIIRHIPVKIIRITIASLALIQAGYFAYTAYR